VKIFRENPKVIEMGHKRALYTKIKLFFIVSGKIKWPCKSYLRMKLYRAVRMAEEV